jgi:mono/diheme cytochrome c family protein
MSGLQALAKARYNGQLAYLSRRTPLTWFFSGRAPRVVRILAFAACAVAAACSRSAPAAEPAAIDAGALFEQACAKCHAGDGRGGLSMAANGPRPIDLTAGDWQRSRSDQELVTTIRNGRGAMPPFGDVLTTEQINALGAYVRTLTRR